MFSAMVAEVLENSKGIQLYCVPPLCSEEAEGSQKGGKRGSTLCVHFCQTGRGGSRVGAESCGSRSLHLRCTTGSQEHGARGVVLGLRFPSGHPHTGQEREGEALDQWNQV